MEEVLIPKKRMEFVTGSSVALDKITKACRCTVGAAREGNSVVIKGEDAYCEFVGKNIMMAIGRGFDVDTACLLARDGYYFSYIDLKQAFGSEKRMLQVKARIIGREGKTKRYIESLTSVKMSVYGHTVGFIGRIGEIEEAETAVRTLMEGSTHRLAYGRMEARHRRNRDAL